MKTPPKRAPRSTPTSPPTLSDLCSQAFEEPRSFAKSDPVWPARKTIAKVCAAHQPTVNALTRITEKVERAVSLRRGGGTITDDDWKELHQLAHDARETIKAANAASAHG